MFRLNVQLQFLENVFYRQSDGSSLTATDRSSNKLSKLD